MSFNPEKQYRCTIIRGKAKNLMDDLLPAYAHILERICPCSGNSFTQLFNAELLAILPSVTVKTLNNHRTEIAGKLFGMYYKSPEDVINISERTEKLLEDFDQPAFFKDICYKFQFPNGMDKIGKTKQDIRKGINIRQCSYVLEVLKEADNNKVLLTVHEVGYYVLNALEVLQGKTTPKEVVAMIIDRRKKKVNKRVPSGSHGTQHIRETFNYLELSNLIRIIEGSLILNKEEKKAINFISKAWDRDLDFDLKYYNLNTLKGRKQMYFKWQEYYSKVSTRSSDVFFTSVKSISKDIGSIISVARLKVFPFSTSPSKGSYNFIKTSYFLSFFLSIPRLIPSSILLSLKLQTKSVNI